MPTFSRRTALIAAACAMTAGAGWVATRQPGRDEARALYASPLPKPKGPLNVYHLGHSLVGRDMPAMLAQLAGPGHGYDSQLGWGTSLKEHWEPDLPINGFAHENDHSRFRPAHEAVQSGEYDAVILTEMVEIRDAIRHHDSAEYLALWAGEAWDANPDTRIYLYETWHHTDDGNGWLYRIDRDLKKYWQGRVKYPALAETAAPIHLIPAGQVMAEFVRLVDDAGGTDDVKTLHDLFTRREDGTPDTIHFNDLGAYLVALTHFAVLYHRDPQGMPHQLMRANGAPATAPTEKSAAIMQQAVAQVVARHPETGVAA